MKIFRERLKELRKNNNLSQKQLADILKTNNSSICDWECGRTEPSIETVSLMADFFECSIDYLVGREDELGIISINSQTGFNPSGKSKEMLSIFESLSKEYQAQVIEYARYIAERTSKSGSRRA